MTFSAISLTTLLYIYKTQFFHQCSTLATPHEIDSLILNLKLKGINDENDIPPFLLRIAKTIVSFPLAFMINNRFSLGIISKTMQQKFYQFLKKSKAKNILNYCPIFLFPSISKIYEHAIYNRTILFFDRDNMLAPNQFGFRKKFIHKSCHSLSNFKML